jgi:hypothetical protein
MLFLLILILSLIAQLFLPWWSVAVVCFALAFWKAHRGGQAFTAGFLGVGLTWLGAALFWQVVSDGILSARVAEMFTVGSPWVLLVVTVILGGLVGGVSAVSGFFVRRALV